MAGIVAPVSVGLAAGVALVVLFAMYANSIPARTVSTVIIPEGSSFDSSGKNLTPETIKVMIGVNNTVAWVNRDVAVSSIVADDRGDQDFFDATSQPDFLLPGEEFRHAFMWPSEFGYHSEPHPWKQGAVISPYLPGNTTKRNMQQFTFSSRCLSTPGWCRAFAGPAF